MVSSSGWMVVQFLNKVLTLVSTKYGFYHRGKSTKFSNDSSILMILLEARAWSNQIFLYINNEIKKGCLLLNHAATRENPMFD